jgi:hypothetical protein
VNNKCDIPQRHHCCFMALSIAEQLRLKIHRGSRFQFDGRFHYFGSNQESKERGRFRPCISTCNSKQSVQRHPFGPWLGSKRRATRGDTIFTDGRNPRHGEPWVESCIRSGGSSRNEGPPPGPIEISFTEGRDTMAGAHPWRAGMTQTVPLPEERPGQLPGVRRPRRPRHRPARGQLLTPQPGEWRRQTFVVA